MTDFNIQSLINEFPAFIRNISYSSAAWLKKRKKYGKHYRYYYEYLLSHSSAEQEIEAKIALDEFLTMVQSKSHFYAQFRRKMLDEYPILDKEDVLKNRQTLALERPYFIAHSSGTTGQPIKIPYSIHVYQKEYAHWWYHRAFCGIQRGDKIATFAGHRVANVDDKTPPFWVMNLAENQLFFSSYHLSMDNMRFYLDRLNKFKPRFIHGYPSSIYFIAKYILEENITLNFHPKMIVTASETTLDFQKNAIEQAFNCKNYIWYGNTELCGHITECQYGRLHVQPYHSYVRFVNRQGLDIAPGQEGFIVATNFTNTAFALINYNTKDIVRLSMEQECKCGQVGKIVDYIVGRIEDYIITPDGRYVGRLDHLFKHANNVRNAQIEQVSINKLFIRIEKGQKYNTRTEQEIIKEASNRLGPGMNIEFDYTNPIEKESNGKYKFIIQHLDLGELATSPV